MIQAIPRKASSGPHLVQGVIMVRLLLQRSKSQKLVLANVGNGSVTDYQLRSFFPSENTLKFRDNSKQLFSSSSCQVTDRACYPCDSSTRLSSFYLWPSLFSFERHYGSKGQ